VTEVDTALSELEMRITELVAQGCKNREIANRFATTEPVIKHDLLVIYDKLGLWNRVELALWKVKQDSK
jgi:DNA-binding NarL/FixJ family response regulator